MLWIAQAHMDNIWARWLTKYLPVHNNFQKCYNERQYLEENDMVWFFDHREKRGFYRLRRVKKCHFGNDGNFRSSDVLTQSGVVFRTTVKLSREMDGLGCVPRQNKHRAGREKAKKPLEKKDLKLGEFAERYSDPNEKTNPEIAVTSRIWAKSPI